MCEREAAGIPAFFAFALIMLGGFLFLFELNQDSPMPDLQRQLDEVHSGNETSCVLRQDSKEHKCRVEAATIPSESSTLWCFCAGRVFASDDRASVEANVFAGPETQLERNRSDWCQEVLTHKWPNAILLEHVGQLHWSCNIIVDDAAEPCRSNAAEKRARDRQRRHQRCFNDIIYNTKRHHACVSPLIPNVDMPCVRLLDDRLLLGAKSALLGQLDEHHGAFHDTRHWTLMITGSLVVAGIVTAAISFFIYLLGQRNERLKAHEANAKKKPKARAPPMRIGMSRPDGTYSGNGAGEIELRQRPNTSGSERDAMLVSEKSGRARK